MNIFSWLFIVTISAVSSAFSAEMIQQHTDCILNTIDQEKELWVEWDSPEGLSRIQTSDAKENFWKYMRFYESQIRVGYCSVASSVMVLNALSIQAPLSKYLGKYRMFTQEEFFSDAVRNIIDPYAVEREGMALIELAQVLETFPITVEIYEAQSLSHEEMRNVLISALKNPNQSILALYQRRVLGQEGGGHWSPVAAYDSTSDSFLVMDVARFKYPPVWIPATPFLNSMQTSNIYGQSRGFIRISNSQLK